MDTVLVHNELAKRIRSVKKGVMNAQVHSIFERAVNLQVGGELCTIAPIEIGKGPFGILLPATWFSQLKSRIEVSDPLILSDQGIRNPEGMLCWDGRMTEYTLPKPEILVQSANLEVNVGIIRRILQSYLPTSHTALEKGLAERLDCFCQTLAHLSVTGNRNALADHIVSGLGMGLGLTPSADDIVLGWMAVVSAEGSPWRADARSALRKAVQSAHETTTDVSAQMLNCAARGFYKQSVVNLIRNMQEKPVSVEDFAEVLSIGHFSGMDILRGIHLGFLSLLQRRNAWQ